MAYELLGNQPKVPQAELESLVSRINRSGDRRVGGESAGKVGGMRVWHKATSDGALKEVVALGPKSSDGWRVVDGSGTVTPVNLSTWTVGADSSYSSGLLTTDGGNDAAGRVSQAVALKIGKYLVSGQAAYEGTKGESPNYVAPRIRLVGSSSGTTTKVFKTLGHATAAENADPKEDFAFVLNVTADESITITLDLVDETTGDATLGAGSAYISLNPLEAY